MNYIQKEIAERKRVIKEYEEAWRKQRILATILLGIILFFIFTFSSSSKAGPFLELGIGDFIGPHDWPDSPECGCGVYLGNEGALGMIQLGIESNPIKMITAVKTTMKASVLHISNVGTGQDTGINAAFVSVKLQL